MQAPHKATNRSDIDEGLAWYEGPVRPGDVIFEVNGVPLADILGGVADASSNVGGEQPTVLRLRRRNPFVDAPSDLDKDGSSSGKNSADDDDFSVKRRVKWLHEHTAQRANYHGEG